MLHSQAQFQSIREVSGPRETHQILSHAERSAVELAWMDSRVQFRLPRALAIWADRLFGFRMPQRLADPMLEALRRFSIGVLVCQEDTGALNELTRAGFAPEKIVVIREALAGRVPAATLAEC